MNFVKWIFQDHKYISMIYSTKKCNTVYNLLFKYIRTKIQYIFIILLINLLLGYVFHIIISNIFQIQLQLYLEFHLIL